MLLLMMVMEYTSCLMLPVVSLLLLCVVVDSLFVLLIVGSIVSTGIALVIYVIGGGHTIYQY